MTSHPLIVQSRVISALMLRDVKTRFGGNPMNYLVAIAWPLSHIAILLTIYVVMGRTAPYGDSTLQFFATGVLPYIIFNYPARFVMMSVMTNMPLLGFPIVKLSDIIFARVILEIISALAVLIVCVFTLSMLNVNVIPEDPAEAIMAILATLMFASGVGMVNALIVKKVPGWLIIFIGVSICIYLTSGIIFIVDGLPAFYRDLLSWNPLLQSVCWMRSSFYPEYCRLTLDRRYLVICGIVSILIGLAGERLARRWLVSS